MTTVDEARVEAALRAFYDADDWTGDRAPWVESQRECMSRALAAADAVRDQQGAPSRPGWSAEPEPVPVSAAGGDHPSRKLIAEFVGDLREAMSRRKIARAGTDEPGEAWDGIAQIMCAHMWERGPLFGDFVVHALSHPAPAIEARSAETVGLGLKGESAAGEAGAPQVEVLSCSSEVARRVAQIARERDALREEVERLREFARDVDEISRSGQDTISFLVSLHKLAKRAAALTPPPTPA